MLAIVAALMGEPAVSPFFTAANALCQRIEAVKSVDASSLGAAQDARTELVRYCEGGTLPAFAGASDVERMATLATLARAAGIGLPEAPARAATAAAGWLEEPPNDLAGPVAMALREGVLALCEEGALRRDFPRTCEGARGSHELSPQRLRRLLLQDLFEAALGAARRAPLSPTARDAALTLGAVSAALAAKDLRAFVTHARALARGMGGKELDVAATVLERVLRDEGSVRSREELVALVVRAVARELGSVGRERGGSVDEVSAAGRRMATALAASPSPRVFVSILVEAERVARLLSSARGPAIEGALARALDLVDSMESHGFTALVELALPAIDLLAIGGDAVTARNRWFRLLAAIASARTPDDLKRAARSAVLPLPPWTEPWLLDVSASVPRLTSDGLRLNADGAIGYQADRWGILLRGGRLSTSFRSPDWASTTTRTDAGFEGWWSPALTRSAKLEARGEAGYTVYSVSSSDGVSWEDERSRLFRATGLLGVRATPSERLSMAAWLGGGIQRDRYDFIAYSRGTLALPSTVDWTYTLSGRLRGQYAILPGSLSLRARVDGRLYHLAHVARNVTIQGGELSIADSSSRLTALEISGRLSADVDALAFAGFTPAVLVGVDVTSVGGSRGITPSAGLGIRRESF